MKRGILLGAALFLAVAAGAQERSWEYWKNADGYLSDQAEVLLDYVDATLQAYPPSAKPGEARRLAFTALDAVLHETRYDDSPQFHAFLDKRLGRVAEALEGPVKRGVTVYKLYNDGFVVRTPKLTVGFDFCGNRKGVKVVPDALLRRLVNACDVLFISHRHQDHADPLVVRMAGEAGIPVYGPADFKCEGFQVIHTDPARDTVVATKRGSVGVLALPGHQRALLNNIYVVTLPGGKTVAHFGDQDLEADKAWLFEAPALLRKRLDIMIINGWNPELDAIVRSFNPRVVLSGHENEMFHGIDHREALWLTQYKFDTLAFPMPAYTLVWGERFRY
jgi:L-ascorbate metabolism protein UlaG (beta-lactamase superfamily)